MTPFSHPSDSTNNKTDLLITTNHLGCCSEGVLSWSLHLEWEIGEGYKKHVTKKGTTDSWFANH